MAKRRPSGDGMVRKREDGRWEGRIVVGHKEDGDPIFQYVLASTQKALLAKLHQNIETFRDVELCEDSRMTLAQWLDRWLDEYAALRLRESTMSGYRMYAEQYIKPRLGNKKMNSITPADIQRMYTKLKKEGRVREQIGRARVGKECRSRWSPAASTPCSTGLWRTRFEPISSPATPPRG